ncbi:MAG TPA: isoprenylcysteine carboxylmethyltransferase family protein [Solirubrobacterales bacterium]|nr:isoprenylcysteine carboxylmethyltransferase family protein [Solirubrobacterales bacterium]
MKPLYATDALAASLYWMVIVVWIVSEGIIFARHLTVVGERRQDRLSGPALIAGLLVAVWVGGILAYAVRGATITTARPVVFAAGLVLAVAGVAIRQFAIVTLGRFFSIRVKTQAGQTVIDTGLYRLIRHPSYAGTLLTVLGVLLCATNWVSLACFVLALPGFAYRIRVEEAALTSALGQPYRDYMRRTKRLVPFVV